MAVSSGASMRVPNVRCTFSAFILTSILILFAWTVNIVLKYPPTVEDIINSNSKVRFWQYLLLSSNENYISGPQRNVWFLLSLIMVGLTALHKENSGTVWTKNWNPQKLPRETDRKFYLTCSNRDSYFLHRSPFSLFSFYINIRTVTNCRHKLLDFRRKGKEVLVEICRYYSNILYYIGDTKISVAVGT
jgi:hypothetical protein